jgi:hypothetical protein
MAELDNSLQQYQMSQSEVRKTAGRQTPVTSFSETFQRGLSTTANSVSNAASAAGYAIPGGTVVSAAISGVGTVRSSTGGLSSVSSSGTGLVASTGTVGTTATTATTGTSSNAFSSVATNAAAGDSSSQLLLATQQMQEMNQNFNLQYLQLQESMQQDSRQYTAMSNVIKTKSDTAKNSLSNIK